MKKLLLFAAAATMFAACSKDTTEDINVLHDGILRVSFSEDDSRVQLDENSRTVWNEGDLISVFNKTTGNECWRFDGKTGDSVGTISKVSESAGGSAIGKIFAVYPYAESNTVSADGTITTEIPATQKYCADSYGVGNNIMIASSESGDLAFKNALGWIKIRLSGTGTVKSLVLEGNDGETLTGTATIDAGLAVSLAADASKSLTLDCGEGVALSSDPTAFYFAVVPQVFEKGITVTAHYSDGSTFEKSTDKPITVERNHIVPMTEIITSIPDNEIWYTSLSPFGKIIPNNDNCFGAKLISNEYKDGLGVMTFNGPVTKIGDDAFANFTTENAIGLMSIHIPPKVESIGTNAFYRCLNLVEIALPNSLVEIKDQAFMCTALSEINIPNSVKIYGRDIMSNCNNLQKINSKYSTNDGRCLIIDGVLNSFASYGITEYELPNTIQTIGFGVFCGKTSIRHIGFPQTLKTIEGRAFETTGLTNVIIPEGVTEIHDWAFRSNDYLESIHFPNTLNFLGQTVVGMSPNLRKITGKFSSPDNKAIVVDGEIIAVAPYELREYTIPIGVHTIGEDLFWNNDIIEEIIIPEGVITIKRGAFFSCDCLKHIQIPSTIESIGFRILGSCSNLEKISGPYSSSDNKCLIKDDILEAFAPSGLNIYTIPNNVKEIRASVFDCVYLESITIPEGVEIIDEDAFRICPNLTSITIPSTVKSIGNFSGGLQELFYGCSALSKIICKATTPPDLLVPLRINAPIYVPQESIEAYAQHDQWRNYKLLGIASGTMYESTDYSQDGVVTILQKATKGKGIDIILMGDGYSDRLIANGAYKANIEYLYNNLFTEEPYKSFRDMFNVYYVTVVSKNEGYGVYNETTFSGYFGDGTIVGGNDAKAFEYAQKAIAAERMDDALIVVMMNSQAYAGTCYMYYPSSNSDYGRGVSVAYFPLGTDNDMFAQLLHHEACGHGFAKLDDEYAYEYMGAVSAETVAQHNQLTPYGWYKNTDFTSDPATVKWHTFLSDPRYANDGLGVFEGGATYWTGVWRPTENSIMRYNTGGFNAPSREAIYYRIHKLAYGESWNYDYEDFVAYDAVNRKASAGISFSTPIVPKDFVPLAPPVVVGKSWRDAR